MLIWIPWPACAAFVALVSFRATGWGLAFFSLAVCGYLLLTGYWQATMNTMVLVLLAVPISVGIGFVIGIWAFFAPRARTTIEATLDVMQTVPAFAYLIPLLVLFGFGPVVGLFASVIYAVPPMVRNTLLGLRQVPVVIKESSLMSGSTIWQQFWFAEVPSAKPQLLVGLNQTTMAAFSMVIIGSLAGGSDDIGWEVLSAVRQAEFGRSLMSGLVIALVAILIDRITIGFANSQKELPKRTFRSAPFVAALIGALLSGIVLRSLVGDADWLYGSTQFIHIKLADDLLLGFVHDYAPAIEIVKNTAISFVVLPIRIGFANAISPFTWGIELTPLVIAIYAGLVLMATFMAARVWGWRASLTSLWAGMFLYVGVTTFPWTGLMIAITFFCWRLAGIRYAIFAAAALSFALFSGLWQPMVESLYLCVLAVILCLMIGGALGLWAAHSERVSTVLRPICDALQTMPQFVFLIPALMFFKVGDLTALIAVMLYAIVPPIRYVEHGLRHVPAHVVEAATQVGCTSSQLLWSIKIPLALPTVMLGVNQTIMASLSMLAVAALVGTRDLGQQVYIALGKADAGMGLVAGVMIALIAMVSDRVIRTWCARRQGSAAE